MRIVVFVTVAIIVLLEALLPARAAESPWYVSASAGAYFRELQGGSTTFFNLASGASGPGTQQEPFDPGYMLAMGIGYKLPAHFRIGGEFAYANYQPSKVKPLSAALPNLNGSDFNRVSGGDYDRYITTINGFYDLPIDGLPLPVTQYFGLGLGFSHNELSTARFQSASGVRFTQSSNTADVGVVQVEAGLEFAVSDTITIGPAYRFIHFFGNNTAFGDENAHVVKLGARYSF